MSNDPMNSAGFSIPSLQQYQSLMRNQAVTSVNPNAPAYAKLMASAGFDLSRNMGYLSPEEKQVQAANAAQEEATKEAASSGATDPADQRIAMLTSLSRRFNALGMYDLTARAMTELNALTQRKEEMRKLRAEGNSAEAKALVDVNTIDANIATPGLKNAETTSTTDKNVEDTAHTKAMEPSQIAEQKASAADKYSTIADRDNEGKYYTQYNAQGEIVAQKSIRAGDLTARNKAISEGWIETKMPGVTAVKTGDLGLPNSTENALAKSQLDAATTLAGLAQSARQYKPAFLQSLPQMTFAAQNALQRYGYKLSAPQQADLDNFNSFARNTTTGLNNYIHALTGAQMSALEAQRLTLAVPTLKDSPQEYVSKMREVAREVLGVQKRNQLMIDRGLKYFGEQWDGIEKQPVSDGEVNEFMEKYLGVPSSQTAPAHVKKDEQGYTEVKPGVHVMRIGT